MTKDRLPALHAVSYYLLTKHIRLNRNSIIFFFLLKARRYNDYDDDFPTEGALDYGYRLLVECEYLQDFLAQVIIVSFRHVLFCFVFIFWVKFLYEGRTADCNRDTANGIAVTTVL
jgi:hypothetical protein